MDKAPVRLLAVSHGIYAFCADHSITELQTFGTPVSIMGVSGTHAETNLCREPTICVNSLDKVSVVKCAVRSRLLLALSVWPTRPPICVSRCMFARACDARLM